MIEISLLACTITKLHYHLRFLLFLFLTISFSRRSSRWTASWDQNFWIRGTHVRQAGQDRHSNESQRPNGWIAGQDQETWDEQGIPREEFEGIRRQFARVGGSKAKSAGLGSKIETTLLSQHRTKEKKLHLSHLQPGPIFYMICLMFRLICILVLVVDFPDFRIQRQRLLPLVGVHVTCPIFSCL